MIIKTSRLYFLYSCGGLSPLVRVWSESTSWLIGKSRSRQSSFFISGFMNRHLNIPRDYRGSLFDSPPVEITWKWSIVHKPDRSCETSTFNLGGLTVRSARMAEVTSQSFRSCLKKIFVDKSFYLDLRALGKWSMTLQQARDQSGLTICARF